MAEHPSPKALMPPPWFYGSTTARVLLGFQYPPDRELQDGERALACFILPPFQRPSVWTRQQETKLIESLWAGLPVGAIVFNMLAGEPTPPDGWLLDGQQRVTAISRYLAGEFSVHGYRFTELGRPEQRHFLTMPIACVETKMTNLEQCRDVYDRLAYGGTAHVA